jgi:hypothetical protein
VFLLRAWSRQAFGKTIDIAGFSDDEIVGFGAKLGLSRDLSLKYQLQCAALYDHHLVQGSFKGVHEWGARRWNVFHVSVHCCLALILAHAAWLTYHVAQGSHWIPSRTVALGWWLPDVALFVCLGLNAGVAFRENRDLFRVLLEIPEKATAVKSVAPTAAEQGAAADAAGAS